MRITSLSLSLCLLILWVPFAQAQPNAMDHLYKLKDAKTRSISPENFTGEKGKGGMATLEEGSAARAARELGQGWKVNPYVRIEPEMFLSKWHKSARKLVSASPASLGPRARAFAA